jgi:type III secretion protein S
MAHDALYTKFTEALMQVLIASTPVLLVAVVIGLLVGLLQALTQIHDQTLPQAVKLIATLVLIAVLGPLFAKGILNHAVSVLEEFPLLTR